jgi:hypothetical protein
MRRRALTLPLAGGLAALVAAAALGASSTAPEVKLTDAKADANSGVLDIVGVRFGRGSDGRLRAIVTMAGAWESKALLASKGGNPGSVCLRIYATADPAAAPPDHLVCATVAADGTTLRGEVLTEKAGALPQPTGAKAAVSRPTARSVTLRFSRTSVEAPKGLRFVAEASRPDCPRLSCTDRAPDAPKAARYPAAAAASAASAAP